MTNKTAVVITVDTEPSVAGAFYPNAGHSPLLDEPVSGDVNGRSEALGFLLRTLTRHHLQATFFVETVHVNHFGEGPMGRHVERLLTANQDVQLHLHPCWRSFSDSGPDLSSIASDHCAEVEVQELTELIESGMNQIERWTGVLPNSMRTGNYSSARHVFNAMERADLRCSSNISVAARPPVEEALRLSHGVHEIEGVTELPVTCFRDTGPVGRGRWRPFQLTAISTAEQIRLLELARADGHSATVIVTHPFEFLKRDDIRFSRMRANRLVQRRFEKLCAWLERHSDRFDVVPLHVAATNQATLNPTRVLVGHAALSLLRATSNFTNDRF